MCDATIYDIEEINEVDEGFNELFAKMKSWYKGTGYSKDQTKNQEELIAE